jgi:hypothetical protein
MTAVFPTPRKNASYVYASELASALLLYIFHCVTTDQWFPHFFGPPPSWFHATEVAFHKFLRLLSGLKHMKHCSWWWFQSFRHQVRMPHMYTALNWPSWYLFHYCNKLTNKKDQNPIPEYLHTSCMTEFAFPEILIFSEGLKTWHNHVSDGSSWSITKIEWFRSESADALFSISSLTNSMDQSLGSWQ